MNNTVTKERIDKILENTDFSVNTVFDKCTVVSAKLPNGFVIVEYSACVDKENYDVDLGYEICKKKIINKIWELEGYRLQQKIYKKNKKKNIAVKEFPFTVNYDSF